MHEMGDVTRMLEEWKQGNPAALEALTPLVYAELRQLAAGYLRRERPGHTLQPTALINEAYLRLAGQGANDWQCRSHFIAIAAQHMRQILVDHARKRLAGKRGGGAAVVTLDDGMLFEENRAADLLAVDEVLQQLAEFDPRKARVVELRFFGGLERQEIADVLGVSLATVKTDYKIAMAWISSRLGGAIAP